MRCLGGTQLGAALLPWTAVGSPTPVRVTMTRKRNIRILVVNVDPMLQNPEAERVILEFHNAADPIPACLHVLQNSQDVGAMFQAAVALRKACIGSGWAKLAQPSRLELRVWVLQFIVHHGKGGGHGPMAPVLQTIMEVHAIVVKLLWLEISQEQSCAFIQVRSPPSLRTSEIVRLDLCMHGVFMQHVNLAVSLKTCHSLACAWDMWQPVYV